MGLSMLFGTGEVTRSAPYILATTTGHFALAIQYCETLPMNKPFMLDLPVLPTTNKSTSPSASIVSQTNLPIFVYKLLGRSTRVFTGFLSYKNTDPHFNLNRMSRPNSSQKRLDSLNRLEFKHLYIFSVWVIYGFYTLLVLQIRNHHQYRQMLMWFE